MARASVYAKEMLAITQAVGKWRHYLLGRHFTICTDHRSLKNLLTQVIQTPEQQIFLCKLLGYDFTIVYKPGKFNTADTLSRSFEQEEEILYSNNSEAEEGSILTLSAPVNSNQGLPAEFHGAKLIGSSSFPFPWYKNVQLSLALSPRIISQVANFKPDVIHATSPGVMAFGALLIAKFLSTPLVMSYHTHLPIYISNYTFSWLVKPAWLIIKFLHRLADLTLVPSTAIGQELQEARVTSPDKIRLWNKGVDSEKFHPCYRSKEMRIRLSDGEPERPLIVHVGRLGAEKNLDFLKRLMDCLPEARIAIVGDGPYRQELENMFIGTPSVFTGMLHGEELSQAYSSGDVFVMPSESETLGFVVLEAMSSGVPVVAARAGGIPEIIPADHEGKTGFMYTPRDLEDCVSKVEMLLKNKELRETMGEKARKEIEKYTWLAASRTLRNKQYDAAIRFWRKSQAEAFNPLRWFTKWIPQSPKVNIEVSQT